MSFSNSGGPTLALPSPTHVRHVDVTSAVRSLRRSLSRSPSKFSLSRVNSDISLNLSESNPNRHPPSPQSPGQRPDATNQPVSAQPSRQPGLACQAPFSAPLSAPCLTPYSAPSSASLSAPTSVAFTAPPVTHPAAFFKPAGVSTPLRSSIRLSLRSAKFAEGAQGARSMLRPRASPKSPSRRAAPLVSLSDGGNAPTPTMSILSSKLMLPPPGQENLPLSASLHHPRSLRRSWDRPAWENTSRHSLNLDFSESAHNFGSFATTPSPDSCLSPPTSGALKRSDAMDLDQNSMGSPVAKRRSLHGISALASGSAIDFGIFSQLPLSTPPPQLPQSQSPLTAHPTDYAADFPRLTEADHRLVLDPAAPAMGSSREPLPSPTPNPASGRRPASLRRSTLQQRHGERDRGSWGRRTGALHLAQLTGNHSLTPVHRTRPRLSVDQFVPLPIPRDSPFGAVGPLPNPSAHLIDRQPHPLSKAISPSSSGNSLVEDDIAVETNEPVRQRGPFQAFSKSMPYGQARPTWQDSQPSSSFNTTGPVYTPKYAQGPDQLWQGAFHSTGLVSKMNRNPESEFDKGMMMPDTPCKKNPSSFNTFPPPQMTAAKRANFRSSFGGLPSTPFRSSSSSGPTPDHPTTFARPGLFRRFARPAGRGSIISSQDDDDINFSLEDHGNVFPEPKTRTSSPRNILEVLYPSSDAGSSSPSYGRDLTTPHAPERLDERLSIMRGSTSREAACKLIPVEASVGPVEDQTHQASKVAPTTQTAVAPKYGLSQDFLSIPSFGRSRAGRGFAAPSPLRAITAPQLSTSPETVAISSSSPSARKLLTRLDVSSTASPADRDKSPKTPQGRMTPQGSITPQRNKAPLGSMPPPAHVDYNFASAVWQQDMGVPTPPLATQRASSMPLPVTPTTTRGQDRRGAACTGLVTPANIRSHIELDLTLLSRFNKVEPIGRGEFSIVYKVTTTGIQHNGLDAPRVVPTSDESSRTSVGDRIYAVKRSRNPYHGNADREAKLREARILAILAGIRAFGDDNSLTAASSSADGYSQHVLRYVDHWEDRGYVYIQTEYCEEGTLFAFLDDIGRKGRLDDFRIWKILHDVALGLREIHDAGFMHLDLKPANILITFEGGLKVADFGMALGWPAEKGADAEGDREYIGPEILRGEFDRSADIFSLGLMLLEMACNVLLPHNGPTWIALRSGDTSEVPGLTRSLGPSQAELGDMTPNTDSDSYCRNPSVLALSTPPAFMTFADHASSLDSVFKWMISPDPPSRPTVRNVLQSEGLQWVAHRRRSPATVFEGNWGPSDDTNNSFSAIDTEMTGV